MNFVFITQAVEQLSKVGGVSKILLADNEAYKGFLPGMAYYSNGKASLVHCACEIYLGLKSALQNYSMTSTVYKL